MESTVVAVTGARRGQELVDAFARRGATVVHAPMLSGDHPAADEEIAVDTRLILDLQPQWIVATTGVGMRLWLESAGRAGHHADLTALLQRTRCLARGAKAAGGLAGAGVKPVWTAPRETDATVAGWLAQHALPGDGVAVQLHGGHPRAYDVLADMGMDVVSVLPYRTGPPTDMDRARDLVERLLAGEVDVIAFTSPGAVRNLVDVAESFGEDCTTLLRAIVTTRTAIAAVGPVTAGTCEDLGLLVRMQPTRYRSMDLVREVESWVARQPHEPSTHVTLDPSASAARVDDIVISLGKREYLVLATLSRRSGGVCRTEELLVSGWGHEAPDDASTVKLQVARLRRKLDGTSVAIQTVRGVGYRLVAAS